VTRLRCIIAITCVLAIIAAVGMVAYNPEEPCHQQDEGQYSDVDNTKEQEKEQALKREGEARLEKARKINEEAFLRERELREERARQAKNPFPPPPPPRKRKPVVPANPL